MLEPVMDDLVICARKVERGAFRSEPGPSVFLEVPAGALPSPAHGVRRTTWVKRLRRRAVWGVDARTGRERGDVLIFIHGYNNSQRLVMQRHRQLQADLREAGFKGVVVSFDWPSADMTLNYVEDRHDAKRTAMHLVDDGIRLLAEEQGPDCTINVHLLAHSTGAYVVREAFDDADDAALAQSGWVVSQVAFIGADVSARSLSAGDSSSEALYRHAVRLTNYSNLRDRVLKISNAKRLGMAPRAGRVGLPADAPAKAVNVDCTAYFDLLAADPAARAADQRVVIGEFAHSWHIGNRVFAADLFEALRGDDEPSAVPTRTRGPTGALQLVRIPARGAP
jgi:esterase/lipase superfamily enzyme